MSGLDPAQLSLGVLFGAGVGFVIGMTGIGGGVLVLPVLILILRVDPVAALGTALVYAFMTKISATIHHARLGNVNARVCKWVIVGVLPGVVAASAAVIQFKRAYPDVAGSAVRVASAIVVIVSLLLMGLSSARKRRGKDGDAAAPDAPGGLTVKGPLFGVLIGALMGATSIGGGVFMLPVLISTFGLRPRVAIGSSALISLLAAVAGAVAYQGGGEIHWPAAISMAAGSVAGVPLGARAATRLPERYLRWVILVVMAAAAVMLLSK